MCMLLKFDYATFGASDLFFKSYRKKNLWGGRRDPPALGKERFKIYTCRDDSLNRVVFEF